MDVLKEQAYPGPSLGKEAHGLDPMKHNLGEIHRLDVSFRGKRENLGAFT